MNHNDELKDLLDRLKSEVDPSQLEFKPYSRVEPGAQAPDEAPAASRAEPGQSRSRAADRGGRAQVTRWAGRSEGVLSAGPRQAGGSRSRYPEVSRSETRQNQGTNVIWSENKETLLFGVLAALIAVFGGIVSGLDYLTLIGAVVFMLFSFVMTLIFFGYYLGLRKVEPQAGDLADRLESLSRKVEALSTRPTEARPGSGGVESPAGRDLENKVEELRVLVKTLSKAVELRNKE